MASFVDLTPKTPVSEGAGPTFRAALVDAEGRQLSATLVTSLTITNADAPESGNAINDRDAESILNTNGGTLVTTTGLGFNSGSELPEIGDTVEGATSGATGVVQFVSVSSGDWIDGDATGVIHVSDVSGTFQSGENLNISSGTSNVLTTTDAGEGTSVVVWKMEAADTAFQGTAEECTEEYHWMLLAWGWTDAASVARTGGTHFRYTVRRKPTT